MVTRLHSEYDGFYHPTFSASLNLPVEDTSNAILCTEVFRSGGSKITFSLIGYRIFLRFVPSVKPTKEALAHYGVLRPGGGGIASSDYTYVTISFSQRIAVYFPGVYT
jgi:hypothetical protein